MVVAGHGHDAADRLQVHQHVTALEVPADAHEPGERRVAEPRGSGSVAGVAVQPPDPSLVDGGPRRRGVRAARGEPQVDHVVVDGGGEHRGQRGLPGAAGGAEATQRAVEPRGAVLVGADAQGHLGLQRLRVGGAPAAPAAFRGERPEHPGREQAPEQQVPRQSPGFGRDARPCLRHVRNRPALGRRGSFTGRGYGVVDGGARRGRGLDPVDTGGVLGHHEHPAGLDQPAEDELPAVGLLAPVVEVVDLLPPPAVPEVPLGDVPEVVVVVPLRRLDDVDLLADHVGHVLGHPRVGRSQPLLRGALRGSLVRVPHLLATTRVGGAGVGPVQLDRRRGGRAGVLGGHARRDRARGAAREHAADEQRTDEPARELLGEPAERHRARQAVPADGAGRLDHHADRELQPRQPDHQPHHHQQGLDVEGRGQILPGGQAAGVRRRAAEQPQADRHADQQHEQREAGPERGADGSARLRLLRGAEPRRSSVQLACLGRCHAAAFARRPRRSREVTRSPPARWRWRRCRRWRCRPAGAARSARCPRR